MFYICYVFVNLSTFLILESPSERIKSHSDSTNDTNNSNFLGSKKAEMDRKNVLVSNKLLIFKIKALQLVIKVILYLCLYSFIFSSITNLIN